MTYDMSSAAPDTVFRVLRRHNVIVLAQVDGLPGMLVFSRDGVIDVRRKPERFRKKILHHLARKFDIPVFEFWN